MKKHSVSVIRGLRGLIFAGLVAMLVLSGCDNPLNKSSDGTEAATNYNVIVRLPAEASRSLDDGMVKSFTTYYEVIFKDRSVVDPTDGYTSAAGRGASLSLSLKGDRYYDIMLLAGTDDRVLLASAFANHKDASGFATYSSSSPTNEGYFIEAGKMNVIDLVLTPITIHPLNPLHEEDPLSENEFVFEWMESVLGTTGPPEIGRNTPGSNLTEQKDYLRATRTAFELAETKLSTLIDMTTPSGVPGESIAWAITKIEAAAGTTINPADIKVQAAQDFAVIETGDLNGDHVVNIHDVYAKYALGASGLTDVITDLGATSTSGTVNIYDVIYNVTQGTSTLDTNGDPFTSLAGVLNYAKARYGNGTWVEGVAGATVSYSGGTEQYFLDHTGDVNKDRLFNTSDLIAQVAIDVLHLTDSTVETIYHVIAKSAVASNYPSGIGTYSLPSDVENHAYATAKTDIALAVTGRITAASAVLYDALPAPTTGFLAQAQNKVDAFNTTLAAFAISGTDPIDDYSAVSISTDLDKFKTALKALKVAVSAVYEIVKGQARTSVIEKAIDAITTDVKSWLTWTPGGSATTGDTILGLLGNAAAALAGSPATGDPLHLAMTELQTAATEGQTGIDNYNKAAALEASYDMVLSLKKRSELPSTVEGLRLTVTLKDYLAPLIQAHPRTRTDQVDTAYSFPFYPATLHIDSFAQRSSTTFSQFSVEGDVKANSTASSVTITYEIPRNMLLDKNTYAKLYVTMDYYPFGTRYAAQKWTIRNGLSNEVDNEESPPDMDIYSSATGGSTFVIVGEGGAPKDSDLLLLFQ